MSDSFATRDTLSVNGQDYTYFSLAKLGQRFDLSRLPFSMKILLENLLRCEDGVSVTKASIEAVATWNPSRNRKRRSPSCRRAWCCRTSPACPAWWTWRRCATRSCAWAAMPATSIR
jgi:aconitase A